MFHIFGSTLTLKLNFILQEKSSFENPKMVQTIIIIHRYESGKNFIKVRLMQVRKWQKRKREKKGMSIEDQAKKKLWKLMKKRLKRMVKKGVCVRYDENECKIVNLHGKSRLLKQMRSKINTYAIFRFIIKLHTHWMGMGRQMLIIYTQNIIQCLVSGRTQFSFHWSFFLFFRARTANECARKSARSCILNCMR